MSIPRFDGQASTVLTPSAAGRVCWHAPCTSLPGRRNPMITALEIGAGLLLTATLLAAAMAAATVQLGSLATRDDEQRQAEAAGAAHSRCRTTARASGGVR